MKAASSANLVWHRKKWISPLESEFIGRKADQWKRTRKLFQTNPRQWWIAKWPNRLSKTNLRCRSILSSDEDSRFGPTHFTNSLPVYRFILDLVDYPAWTSFTNVEQRRMHREIENIPSFHNRSYLNLWWWWLTWFLYPICHTRGFDQWKHSVIQLFILHSNIFVQY